MAAAGPTVRVYETSGPTSNPHVAVIDAVTNALLGNVSVPADPEGVVTSPDGSRAYVMSGDAGIVSVIDTSLNTVIASISGIPNGHFAAVSPDGAQVYVSRHGLE